MIELWRWLAWRAFCGAVCRLVQLVLGIVLLCLDGLSHVALPSSLRFLFSTPTPPLSGVVDPLDLTISFLSWIVVSLAHTVG